MLARHDYISCLFFGALTLELDCLDVALEHQILQSATSRAHDLRRPYLVLARWV